MGFDTYAYELMWKAPGQADWEGWWVEKYGYTRERIPGLDDHISFANFDLSRIGTGPIVKGVDGRLTIDIDMYSFSGLPPNAGPYAASTRVIDRLSSLVEKHGFEFILPEFMRDRDSR